MLKKVVEDIIFWLFLFTGLGENQVILLYVGFFPLNIMIVIGIFVDDLYQIEGIFLYILLLALVSVHPKAEMTPHYHPGSDMGGWQQDSAAAPGSCESGEPNTCVLLPDKIKVSFCSHWGGS